MMENLTLSQAQSQSWDVIIVGAGLGGGVLGRRLTERGLSVLFVERGPVGRPSENHTNQPKLSRPEARQVRSLWPKAAEARLNGGMNRLFGPYGAGVGGSSVFYAAALERPERHDLDDDPNLPHPTGGWPVGYDQFRPYFDQAAEIFHLCGTPDPLSKEPPPPLNPPAAITESDAALMAEMEQRGLHPYRLNLAVKYPDRCRQCFGRKCPWGCKMDGRSAGVVPALATGRAGLLTDCKVREVLEDGARVTGLRVEYDGQDAYLEAQTYALCGGSLGSARLLMASQSRRPEGVANSSGWVGRGLMFHMDEVFVLWARGRFDGDVKFGKSISIRDIYSKDGERFGLVQSMGMDVDYGNIVMHMERMFDQSPLRRWPALKKLARIPALIAAKLFGRAGAFVGVIEDFPYYENRVVLNEEDPEILTFEYTFTDELRRRHKKFRKALHKAFRGHKRFMISLQPMLNFGHPVGTLRFGDDPETSVLRPDCRTHDLENLYVADASFMRSAMGVNPSLTIAANALRVGDVIADAKGASDA